MISVACDDGAVAAAICYFSSTHNNSKRSHLKTLNRKRIAKQVYGFDNGKERRAHAHTEKKLIVFCLLQYAFKCFHSLGIHINVCALKKGGKHFYGIRKYRRRKLFTFFLKYFSFYLVRSFSFISDYILLFEGLTLEL